MANYEKLGEAVVKAILEYKDIPYTSPAEIKTDTYKVVKGDTIYSISNKLGIPINELKNSNNLNTNTLTIGQILKIPIQEVIQNNTEIYVIKKGDTLYSIANSFNTSIDELKKINNISNNILTIGSTIKVPSGLSNNIEYTVNKGDSLYSISKKYNTTVDKIKELNQLTNNILTVGQILKIPNIENVTITYTVKQGDTLYSIAKKYNVNVDLLKSTNDLTNNMLTVGQNLIIPEETTGTYKVVAGDNLYSIARKFNTNVSTIKELNNLSSDILRIGQIIIVR